LICLDVNDRDTSSLGNSGSGALARNSARASQSSLYALPSTCTSVPQDKSIVPFDNCLTVPQEGSLPDDLLCDLSHLSSLNFGGSKLIRLDASIGGISGKALMDGGATHNFISRDFVERNALPTSPSADQYTIEYADGRRSTEYVLYCDTELKIDTHRKRIRFVVIPMSRKQDTIIGKPWFDEFNPDIDWPTNTLHFTDRGRQITLKQHNDDLKSHAAACEVSLVDAFTWKQALKEMTSYDKLSVFGVWLRPTDTGAKEHQSEERQSADSTEFQSKLAAIKSEFKDIFSEPTGIHQRGVYHRIPLLPDAMPPTPKLYRLSFNESDELRKQLDKLLEKGWIRPSSSPYGSPVLFASKKNGALRLCIDYRALNNLTIKDNYALPMAEDCINQLNSGKYKTKLDLYAGYHQIGIHPDDVHKTAMRTKYGSYEWLVMPFGLTSAPATFQRLMNEVLREFLDVCVVVYLDDILIYSKTEAEHLQHVTRVLEALRKAGLHAQESKCEFGMTECEFLGHIITEHGVKVDPHKVSVIQDWPIPQGNHDDIIRDVRSFLGLANYYRRFIGQFAHISAPLTALLKKGSTTWTKEQTAAFLLLKEKLSCAPVLLYPDPSQPFTLFFDSSSKVALGGVLCQTGDDGELHPVAFESRQLTSAEKAYPVHELEALAFVHCVKKWRHFLDAQRFQVFTDNRSVQSILTNRNPSPRLVRWIDWLQRYQFTIKHIPRELNQVADALSNCGHARLPTEVDFQDFEVNEVMLQNAFTLLISTAPDDSLLEKIAESYEKDQRFAGIVTSLKTNGMPDTSEDHSTAEEDRISEDGSLFVCA
jgi:hypothetical protein